MKLKYQYGLLFILSISTLTACNNSSVIDEIDSSPDNNETDSNETDSNEINKDLSTYFTQTTQAVDVTPKTAADTASLSNYGVHTPTDFFLNDDGSIDVYWQDTDSAWHISQFDNVLAPETTVEIILPTSINQQGRFLGFTKNPLNETYYIGYSKDNQFAERDTDGSCVSNDDKGYNCNAEYWVSAFSSTGEESYNTRIFGELDLSIKDVSGGTTKGNPGQAAVGVMKYIPHLEKLAIYTGHLQRFGDQIRHQAGWFGMVDSMGVAETWGGWYSSHNFDQRIQLTSDENIYTLAHGDAYPRALQLTQWDQQQSKSAYTYQYYAIENGSTGDNKTLADTGDLTILSDDSAAIAFATQDSRTSKDVRLKIMTGIKAGEITETQDLWLTEYGAEKTAGKGIKIATVAEDKVLVAWNTFEGETPAEGKKKGEYIDSTVAIYNLEGDALYSMTIEDRLMPTQTLQVNSAGTAAVWVTTSEDGIILNHIDLTIL
ncbi:hypothetical protein [Shewanella gaetbuli]|uniref:Lipoprotein n=1 Tax=Shewanella gaetbuli TaxID=220752 RepID=A0A9X1ZM12_9GAMM|nr:hypothetical protein [Shewanella gaetbuli]MCL1144056.1 hypothetical protein [Shewanella gaetbuli]